MPRTSVERAAVYIEVKELKRLFIAITHKKH